MANVSLLKRLNVMHDNIDELSLILGKEEVEMVIEERPKKIPLVNSEVRNVYYCKHLPSSIVSELKVKWNRYRSFKMKVN